jgi:hypothetical protein
VTPLLRCHSLFGALRPAGCDRATRSAAALGQRARRLGSERRDTVTPRERCHQRETVAPVAALMLWDSGRIPSAPCHDRRLAGMMIKAGGRVSELRAGFPGGIALSLTK